jgi:hypothetical protein
MVDHKIGAAPGAAEWWRPERSVEPDDAREVRNRRGRNGKRPWSHEENDYLRLHPGGGEERIEAARHLGRTISAVTQQLSFLGMTRIRSRRLLDVERSDPAARSASPLRVPHDRVARPAWFYAEGYEDRETVARRLLAGR